MDLQELLSLYFLTCLLKTISAARILAIFPVSAKSHFLFNEAIAKTLHNAGHHITIISPFLRSGPPAANYTFLNYGSPMSQVETDLNFLTDRSIYSLVQLLIDTEKTTCQEILKMKEIQDMLASSEKQYDILIMELFLMYECYLPIAEKLDIPVIGTIPIKMWKPPDYMMGVPNNLATMPLEMIDLPLVMTFTQRLRNVVYNFIFAYQYLYRVPNEIDKVYKHYYKKDLWYKKKISLVFSNNHPILLPRPIPPNVIEASGIHIRVAQPLPKNLQQFIDEARHGVILFTFGSLVRANSLPESIKLAFIEAFAVIRQKVIWKYEQPFDNLPENVMISKWVPQRDILEHENVKAFISHCGQSGVYEAIQTGTPLVAVPLYTDQYGSAAALEDEGAAVRLDINTVTKEKIINALNKIINDTRYIDRMRELSAVFKDRPMGAQETIVYWTEYVLKHKGALHLRTKAADIPLYQYFLLDILALVTLILGLVLIVYNRSFRVVMSTKQAKALQEKIKNN